MNILPLQSLLQKKEIIIQYLLHLLTFKIHNEQKYFREIHRLDFEKDFKWQADDSDHHRACAEDGKWHYLVFYVPWGRQSRLTVGCNVFCLKTAVLANARLPKFISLPASACTEQIASTCTKAL